jgi:hypothetical protein
MVCYGLKTRYIGPMGYVEGLYHQYVKRRDTTPAAFDGALIEAMIDYLGGDPFALVRVCQSDKVFSDVFGNHGDFNELWSWPFDRPDINNPRDVLNEFKAWMARSKLH